MKKLVLPASLCLVGIVLASIGIALLQTRFEVAGETVDSVVNPLGDISLALDSQGRPHISYNSLYPSMLKYVVKRDQKWTFEVVDSLGWKHSFRLDSNNKPHIAYLVHGSNELRYAFRNADGWTIETVNSGIIGFPPSIALDKNDSPHLSYASDGVSGFRLKHALKETDVWKTETVPYNSYKAFQSPTFLAFDPNDDPHIIFREWIDGNDYFVKHAFKSEGNWTIENVDTYKAEGFDGFETFSLAIDDDGNLHMTYPSQYGLKYAVKRDNIWTTETVDPNNWGAYNSLVLDSIGNPQISYMGRNTTSEDPTYYISLNYAVKQNGVWDIEAVAPAGTTAGKFLDTSLTLDPNGKPHISYYVYENEDLKYYSRTILSSDPLTSFARALAPASYAFLMGGGVILVTGIVITIRRRQAY